jgi:hypothetical protein
MVDGGCPVEREGSPCPPKPISASITVVLAPTGALVAAATSGADGQFRIVLPPGSYVLHAANRTGGPYPRSSPVDVEIRAGAYTTITVSFDSGIQ